VLLVFALWMTAVFMLNKLQILSIIFNVRLTCNKQIKSFCSDLKRNSNFLSEKNVERKLIIERVRQMAPKPLNSNFTFFVFSKSSRMKSRAFVRRTFFTKHQNSIKNETLFYLDNILNFVNTHVQIRMN